MSLMGICFGEEIEDNYPCYDKQNTNKCRNVKFCFKNHYRYYSGQNDTQTSPNCIGNTKKYKLQGNR